MLNPEEKQQLRTLESEYIFDTEELRRNEHKPVETRLLNALLFLNRRIDNLSDKLAES